MSSEDNVLIQKYLEGDERSFDALVEKYKKKVFYTAYYICRNTDHAYDIAQEVFIKVFDKLRDFKMKSSFYTWLYRITVNHTFNYIRKVAKTDRQLPLDETIGIPAPEEQNPEKILSRKEVSQAIEKAIDDLPEKQKIIFVLRNYNGLSFSDIAHTVKRTEGATKANYFHAVRNLRKILSTEGVRYAL